MSLIRTIPIHLVKNFDINPQLCVGFVLVWSRNELKVYKIIKK